MTGFCPECGQRSCDCPPDEEDEHDDDPRDQGPIYPKAYQPESDG